MLALLLEKGNPQNIPALEGLRGFAVLLVVLSHLGNVGVDPLPLISFAGIGKAGVYLFFVLSAYLLTQQALKANLLPAGLQGWQYWLAYFIRRFFRIYPLYFLMLSVGVLASYFGWPLLVSLSFPQLIDHLLLQEGHSIFWTIPVEFSYYLVIPVVSLACLLLQRLAVWLPIGLIFVAIIFVMSLWPAEQSIVNGINLGYYLPIFLLGSLGALISPYLEPWAKARFAFWNTGMQIILLIVICFTVPTVWRLVSGEDISNDYFHRSYFLYGLLWTLILLLVLNVRGNSSFFSSYAMCFLGRISFSVYLTHLPIVIWVSTISGPNWIRFLLSLCCIVIIGFISYRLVEVPSMKIGKNISKKLNKTCK